MTLGLRSYAGKAHPFSQWHENRKAEVMNYKLVISFLLYFLSLHAYSQSDTAQWCNPRLKNSPRAKGLEINYERVYDFTMNAKTKDEDLSTSQGEVIRNRKLDLKLKFPLFNKPFLTLAGGFNYAVEEFLFEKESQALHPLFRAMDEKNLVSTSGNLYIIKPFRGNKFLTIRGSAGLNSDYKKLPIDRSEFLKYSVTSLLGWKISDDEMRGIGLSYNYSLGRRLLVPIVVYQKNITDNWNVELVLPQSVKARFSHTPKSLVIGTLELQGNNYNIRLDEYPFNKRPTVYFQHSEIRLTAAYEREIYKIIWMGVKAGLRRNIKADVSESDRLIGDDLILEGTMGTAPLVQVSLFVVAPEKTGLKKNPLKPR